MLMAEQKGAALQAPPLAVLWLKDLAAAAFAGHAGNADMADAKGPNADWKVRNGHADQPASD